MLSDGVVECSGMWKSMVWSVVWRSVVWNVSPVLSDVVVVESSGGVLA